MEGAKLRPKYLADHLEPGFYRGLNSELGFSSQRTEETRWNAELRWTGASNLSTLKAILSLPF